MKREIVKMSAMNKTILREIKQTFGRFISILSLIALGVFAYVGISVTGADMRYTGITYSNEHNLADVFIQSTYGLDQADEEAFAQFPELAFIEYGYATDVSAINTKLKGNHTVEDESTIKLESLPERLSQYEIVVGRLPETKQEIILDDVLASKYQLGDQVTFIQTSNTDASLDKLEETTFTVVGFAHSPEYFPRVFRGSSLSGKGEINAFAGVVPEVFDMDVYTIARGKSTIKNDSLTEKQAYDDAIADQITAIEKQITEQGLAENHLSDLQDKINEQIATGEAQLNIARANLPPNAPEIRQAEENVMNARTKLEKLKAPSYIVNSRNNLIGYDGFFDNGARLDILAYIFPVFLFFVAALVTSTTMTRMVEEQRTQIGTLKALGYQRKSIMKKYLVYGAISGGLGTIIGIVLGLIALPRLIYSAYKTSYIFPNLMLKIFPSYVIIGSLIALFCTVVPVIFAVNTSLNEKATELMRPKVPKIGQRIVLEYIPFVWNHLSFIAKVTARNIFRYKQRMLMTILGVSGCIALIIMGFGIRDSLTKTLDLQLNELYTYDILTQFDTEATEAARAEYDAVIQENASISGYTKTLVSRVQLPEAGKENKELTLIVPQEPNELHNYISLLKTADEPIAIGDSGVVLSQKIAEDHKVGVGDEIELLQDDIIYKAKVGAINQWYFGHQVVFSPAYYQQVFDNQPVYNGYFLKVAHKNDVLQILANLENTEANLSSTSLNATTDIAKGNLDGLNLVMIVLLTLACLLAIIVLYNLTNINISERIRELSTIKVLGFYPWEVTRYIYRETLLLTLIGIIVGWFLGTWLEQFIIIKIPPAEIMFYRGLFWTNYAISSVITFGIALVIMFIMHIKLKRIDMIEALKSIE